MRTHDPEINIVKVEHGEHIHRYRVPGFIVKRPYEAALVRVEYRLASRKRVAEFWLPKDVSVYGHAGVLYVDDAGAEAIRCGVRQVVANAEEEKSLG